MEKKAMELSIIAPFLPAGLLDHFELKKVEILGDISVKKEYYQIELEEYNRILGVPHPQEYESKGFTEITLQDFPIRGKAVFLKLKRRRWRHKTRKNEIIRNNFTLAAEGAGFTQELSDFLKGTGRYARGHHYQHK